MLDIPEDRMWYVVVEDTVHFVIAEDEDKARLRAEFLQERKDK